KKFTVLRDKYAHLKSQSQKGGAEQMNKAQVLKTSTDGSESLSSSVTNGTTTEAASTTIGHNDSMTETTGQTITKPKVLLAEEEEEEKEDQATDLESDLAELEPEKKINTTTTPHNSVFFFFFKKKKMICI
ncbi:hypothetical protein RFI_34964, partial [Reticulomyxa filosa]